MLFNKVPGDHRQHKVIMYTLNNCLWCKKTRQFMSENRVGYGYVDIDSSKFKDFILRLLIFNGFNPIQGHYARNFFTIMEE